MKKINIAIIPARSGSKRIKNKNIKMFCSKPMIYWTINALKKFKYFDKIILTSDSQKILSLGKKFGVDILIDRPKKLSGDKALIDDVMGHALNLLNLTYEIDNVCCVYPCSPFIQKKDLILANKILKEKEDSFIFSVSEYKHPIQRAYSFDIKKSKLSILDNKKYNRLNMTQDYEKYFHDIGQFYLAKNKTWMKKKRDNYGVIIPIWRAVDIDDLEDWKHAELLFNSLNS